MRYINSCVCMAYLLIFVGIRFLWILLAFLSMIINEVYSYTWCLRYNICSAWFLDIRISTCSYNDNCCTDGYSFCGMITYVRYDNWYHAKYLMLELLHLHHKFVLWELYIRMLLQHILLITLKLLCIL